MEQVSMTSAYMWALIITVIFFVVAVVAANMILFKPNNPGTASRRLWFWVCCVAAVVVGLVVNLAVAGGISVPTIKNDYTMHTGIAAGVSLAAYILAGFIVSKFFPNSKVGTWF